MKHMASWPVKYCINLKNKGSSSRTSMEPFHCTNNLFIDDDEYEKKMKNAQTNSDSVCNDLNGKLNSSLRTDH